MPKIEGKSHGVFYGHGTVTEEIKYLSGKSLVLYGPPKTTLADEVAKYIVLYLQRYPEVPALQIGDLGRISGASMEFVQKQNPSSKLDHLSSQLWAAATPLDDYPVKVDKNYHEVKIGPLESVSIYRVRPPFVTEFSRETRLSSALDSTEHDVVHVATCQATSFSDDLIILKPSKSTFAYREDVAVERILEKHEKSLEELYAEKVTTSPSFSFGSSQGGSPGTSTGFGGLVWQTPSVSPFSIQPFSGQPRPQKQSKQPIVVTPEFPPAPPAGMLACLKMSCQAFLPWNGETHCPTCGSAEYEVRYVCRSTGCPVFERGQSEFKKNSNSCQYCGKPIG